MEKAVHGRSVSEEDKALSCSKKPKLEASPSFEDIEKYSIFTVCFLDRFMIMIRMFTYIICVFLSTYLGSPFVYYYLRTKILKVPKLRKL